MSQLQPSHIDSSRKVQDQQIDNDEQPQVPIQLQHQTKKPLPSIENQQDEKNFFFTMVDVEGQARKPKTQTESERSEETPSQSEEASEVSAKEINPLEEVKLLLERFNKYDHKLLGMIPLENARTIFEEMEMDVTNFDSVADISIMTKKEHCTFDEFLAMLNEFEERRFQVNETKLFVRRQFKTDPRLIAFIRLLDEYRRKNELGGEYKEAKSAKLKIKELKQKEAIRKQATLRILHTQQIASLEQLQRKQFQQFSDSWDKYMEDYEKAAIQSLETMKHKHIKELEEYDQKIKDEAPKIYYSKTVLELRTKQKNLVKLQQYEEAANVRIKIDDLQQIERTKHQMDVVISLENKINNFRTKQTSGLNALLKKIQKDRNQQLKTRQTDSERLVVKNRNMRNQLLHRHQDEIKRAVESLKDLMVDEGHRNESKRKSVDMAFK